jgi:uncharacterized Zn finger protein
MPESVLEFLSSGILREYADGSSFARGEAYFNAESVSNLEEYQGKVVAKVSGTRDYRVKLWAEDEDELGYDCTCPFADEGNFCKHCVAVGLAYIANRNGEFKPKLNGKKPSKTLDGIKKYLETQGKSELVEMLMQQVLDNETLRGQLLLITAQSNPKRIDMKAFRKELERAFEPYDFDDYGHYRGRNNSHNIENVVKSIARLLADGHSETVIDLSEYGLKLASEAMNYVDESDIDIEDAIEKLREYHLAACEQTTPDVEKLAQRLFDWEVSDSFDIFYDVAKTYADVLGEKGLQFYRELLEKEWEKLPVLKPKEPKSHDGNRWRITIMMESLAKGDIEKLVEIKSRNLSSQYYYYEIAEIYRENKKYDKALEWAERGVSDFPEDERLDPRLGEVLANEYHRRGRHDEAMQIIWKQLKDNSDFSNYGNLKKHADKVKPKSTWQPWREKALDLIRQKIIAEKTKRVHSLYFDSFANSLIVTIFLHEKLPEEAWQEANKNGCSEDLWLKLAKIREKENPTDSLRIYRERIEPKIKETNNQAYEQAVKWIKEVKRLMSQLDQESEFKRYLVTLRINYKIKRNFIKLMDSTKW